MQTYLVCFQWFTIISFYYDHSSESSNLKFKNQKKKTKKNENETETKYLFLCCIDEAKTWHHKTVNWVTNLF